MPAEIRRAFAPDVAAMMPLIADHAAYERETATCDPEALRAALSGEAPALLAWIAVRGDEAVGYASATIDFSTWSGRGYLHLDCLFVALAHRGSGIGAALLAAARSHATAAGIQEMQWQTPIWNEGAARFYRRLGASEAPKLRFRLFAPCS